METRESDHIFLTVFSTLKGMDGLTFSLFYPPKKHWTLNTGVAEEAAETKETNHLVSVGAKAAGSLRSLYIYCFAPFRSVSAAQQVRKD